jgi:hypothetical protein
MRRAYATILKALRPVGGGLPLHHVFDRDDHVVHPQRDPNQFRHRSSVKPVQTSMLGWSGLPSELAAQKPESKGFSMLHDTVLLRQDSISEIRRPTDFWLRRFRTSGIITRAWTLASHGCFAAASDSALPVSEERCSSHRSACTIWRGYVDATYAARAASAQLCRSGKAKGSRTAAVQRRTG